MGYCLSSLTRSMNSASAMEAGTPTMEEGKPAAIAAKPSVMHGVVVKVATDPGPLKEQESAHDHLNESAWPEELLASPASADS
jgi:hypothetical protein